MKDINTNKSVPEHSNFKHLYSVPPLCLPSKTIFTLHLFCPAQPLSAAAPPTEVSQEATEFKKPQCDIHKPTCPQCGFTVSDKTLHPVPPSQSLLQGSSLSVHRSSSSSRRRSKSRHSVAGSHQPAATPDGRHNNVIIHLCTAFPFLFICLPGFLTVLSVHVFRSLAWLIDKLNTILMSLIIVASLGLLPTNNFPLERLCSAR